MIPLKDNIRAHRKPVVNYAIIACTSVVFLLQLSEKTSSESSLVFRFGMIPERVLHPGEPVMVEVPVGYDAFGRLVVRRVAAAAAPLPAWLTLLTCIFLHGGWLHFLGNMWFLYIFGDNVEDRLGRLGYAAFYLLAGVAASAVHLVTNTSSSVPTIGASGAIAGVMGAYFLLYPWAKVLVLVPIFFFIEILVLPAPLFLGFWFLLPFFQGTLSITAARVDNVAWWAHIGGFLAGMALIFTLRRAGKLPERSIQFEPGISQRTHYRWRNPRL